MRVIFSICLAFVLVIGYVRHLEQKTLFVPSKIVKQTPQAVGLSYEDVTLQTADGLKLYGWFIPSHDMLRTMIFLHGNAGNIGNRLDKIKIFHDMGLNVLIMDYRGFGQSEGSPTENGMYKDAEAIYDYLVLRKDIDPQGMIGYGESLGGVAVIDLATKRKFKELIIDSSFTNALDMAKVIYPMIPPFLVHLKLDSEMKVRSITIPKLFIHSTEDTLVPFWIGRKLYDAAAEPKKFLQLKGSHNHGYSFDHDKFVGGIEEFLNIQYSVK